MAEKYDEKNIQCDSCDFTSPTKRAMNSHVFRKHTCKLLKCDYTSVNSYDFMRHFLALHDDAM